LLTTMVWDYVWCVEIDASAKETLFQYACNSNGFGISLSRSTLPE